MEPQIPGQMLRRFANARIDLTAGTGIKKSLNRRGRLQKERFQIGEVRREIESADAGLRGAPVKPEIDAGSFLRQEINILISNEQDTTSRGKSGSGEQVYVCLCRGGPNDVRIRVSLGILISFYMVL